jgi:hypothetical protein
MSARFCNIILSNDDRTPLFREDEEGGELSVLSLQNRKTLFAALLICSILLTVWFAAAALPFFAFIFAASSIALLIIFGRIARLLQVVRLIRENQILAVPAAWLQENDPGCTCTEESIVSTFGAIIGSRVFQWGQGGLGGSRLLDIAIDRKAITLTFGTKAKIAKLTLLHGLTESEAAMQLQEKFNFETGVKAKLTGWSLTDPPR